MNNCPKFEVGSLERIQGLVLMLFSSRYKVPSTGRVAGGLFLALWLAFASITPPARAQDAGSTPSAEDRLLEVDTELGAEEWQQRAEEKIRELPVEPEDYSVEGAKHPQKLS